MIRIGLLSEDDALYALLASALGDQFQIELATSEMALADLVEAGECDVLMMDLSSSSESIQERIDRSRRIIALQVPTIVMADDALQATAAELVRLGAFGSCGRRPAGGELKVVLCRASESSLLKNQPQTVHPRIEADS